MGDEFKVWYFNHVVVVRDFTEAREKSGFPSPLYIGGEGDLFRLRGLVFDENSPKIYVAEHVPLVRFAEELRCRYRPRKEGEQ